MVEPMIDDECFLTYNPVRMHRIRYISTTAKTTVHAPVSGDRKSGIPAEVLTPDNL